MVGEAGCCWRLPQTEAAVLLMFLLALSVSCFSLRGLGKNVQQDKVVSEAPMMKERAGSLISEPGSASGVDPGNTNLPHVNMDQSEGTDIFAQESQLKDIMAIKAAWKLLNPTLNCGRTKMTFKAMGPGAADLQLDIGNGYALPLSQVHESCGYSMQKNTLGLVLVVPYDGCNVLQENGNYVVLMRWMNTPVKFMCPILQSIDETPDSVTPNPAIHPQKLDSPQNPWSLTRHKRHTPLSIHNPNSQYYLYLWYYYLNWLLTYYPDYYYILYYNHLLATTNMTSTTETTQAPPIYYSFYYPYVIPNNSDIIYYAVIQHFYGKDPPDSVQTTTLPPTSTAQPVNPTWSEPSPMTTAAPTQQTTTKCPKKTSASSNNYPGQPKPFVDYIEQPFKPYVSFDSLQKAGKLPDYQKYMPPAGYKSGLQARAYPNPYWQSVPWFSELNDPRIHWGETLQQKHV